jgi:hypothetical protein
VSDQSVPTAFKAPQGLTDSQLAELSRMEGQEKLSPDELGKIDAWRYLHAKSPDERARIARLQERAK